MIASYSVYRKTVAIWFDENGVLWRSLDGKQHRPIKQMGVTLRWNSGNVKSLSAIKPKFGSVVKVYLMDLHGSVWVSNLKAITLGKWSLVR